MTITEIQSADRIQLDVEGQVDTVTSPELQQALLTAFQKTNHVVLNIEKVNYMSSAGLRALLLAQKTASSKGGGFQVVNVQESVQQVFKMSGFAKILDVG